MILGLDISTSTVGFTLMNLSGAVEVIGYAKPIGKNLYEKVDSARQHIEVILWPYLTIKSPITSIYAEAPNIMFRAGFSSAQVLSTILRFNGALLFTLSKKFNTLPKEAMAVSMRKQVIGVGRFKNNPKAEVLKWVKSQPDFPFQGCLNWWPIVEKGKYKGQEASEQYDMADSYIVARYGLLNESRASQVQS